MITISNYKLTNQIYESANSLVYRGYRYEDNRPVILKVLTNNYPMPEELTRYRQEYDITRRLTKLDGVVNAYHIEKYQNTLVMCLEDFGGESLKIWLEERQFTVEELLRLAIQAAEILGQIHQQNIIHKDINPSNMVFNPVTKVLKIIDFGIATQFKRQHLILKDPKVLEGTLAYMSPEQTGRMNRALDYRTDFYSLGATFYELFTGQLPFDTTDAMELVHCHLAKQPKPPIQINPDLPSAISNIILKLLEKTAEARYQSAYGLKADLENCLNQWQHTGQIETFQLASLDISDRFQMPQKLYGREREIDTLLSAFENVSKGHTQMMLVAGYSGIGKSVLVKEIYQSLTEKQGYFISGKFDQFQRNIPYSALVTAFAELVQQLLTESDKLLTRWKEKLLATLGPNGQIIIDVIPEVELIIGKQPAVPELGPTESQNRFNWVFQNFMSVFCQQAHPLVIFLDDLQWVDSATLKLLEQVMMVQEISTLFLIGAYRDNEVGPLHPLMMTLDTLGKENVTINQITLKPLAFEHINQLIADSLHQNPKAVGSLTDLVMRKTGGNPFFVNQFLGTLQEENLLHFVPPTTQEKGGWQWDIAQIEAIDITDNVVDLMIGKLKKLPESTQHLLRLAACVGNNFDLHTLSVIYEKSAPNTFQDLMPVLTEGLVLPTSRLEMTEDDILNSQLSYQNFQFLHDRVQQAAYALITDTKPVIHLKIARLLLAHTAESEWEDKIFNIVNQFNKGRELIEKTDEKLTLARLNLLAGNKAKASAAYGAARQYLTIGMEISSSNDCWTENYDLAFALHKALAEAEYLTGHFEQSEKLIKLILEQAKSTLQQGEIYNILIIQYNIQGKFSQGIEVGRKALKLLGINLPEEDLQTALKVELARAKDNLGNKAIASLIDDPEIAIPEQKTALKILMNLHPSTYFFNQPLYQFICVKMANISLKYGYALGSAKGYANYGNIVAILGDYQSGYDFGLLGLKLSQKFNDLSQKSKVCLTINSFLHHWRKHLREAAYLSQEGYQSGLESGDLAYAGYNFLPHSVNFFYWGENLVNLHSELSKCLGFVKETKNQTVIDVIFAYQLAAWNLSGLTKGKFSFHNDEIEETQYLETCQLHKNSFALCCFYILKSQIFYLYGKPSKALDCILEAEKRLVFVQGCLPLTEYYFYDSLIRAALYLKADETERQQYWQQLESNLKQMKIWADNCPENFLHKYLLIAAEMARLFGNDLEAMDLYDQAIDSAKKNEFIQNEALGNELATQFWLIKRGKEEIAQIYLKKAHYGYKLWGAVAKVKDLEERYPQFFAPTSSDKSQTTFTTLQTRISSTERSSATLLDLSSVMKASQTLSGEIVLSRLLKKMMHIIIENAGAENGFLLLPQNDNWFIQAQVDSTEVTSFVAVEQSEQVSANIIHYVARTGKNVVLHNATIDGNFTRDPYIVKHRPKSVLCAPLLNQGKLTGILYLENNLTSGAFTTERLEVLQMLSSQAAISLENALLYRTLEQKVEERTAKLKQKNQLIRQVFGRYLSDEIVETLLETESGLSLGGERREITILTSDIRGFCVQANRLPPEQVIKIINYYLAAMTEVITEYQGTINEFMGDGILVLFGAPIARNDDPERALACAVAMQLAMKPVNEQLQAWGFAALEMGIGINTGEVVVGNLGSEKRTKYGVIGNEVNLAYRIESYTIGGQILISEPTLKRVWNLVKIHSEKSVKPKGIQQAITIYEVEGIAGKYKLYLHKEEEVFLPLWKAIPLRYAVIEEKQVNDKQYLGSLVKLSAKSALICCDVKNDCLPEPLTNLKLNLVMPNHSEASEDIYAKVLSGGVDANSLYIHFTSSIPANIKAQLLTHIKLE